MLNYNNEINRESACNLKIKFTSLVKGQCVENVYHLNISQNQNKCLLQTVPD